MEVWQAVVLGCIQGVTEFLPISSDGHLALAEWWLGVRPSLAFNVLLHAGTLAVVLVAMRREVAAMATGAIGLLRSPRDPGPDGRLALHVLVASVPTAAIGLLLRHTAEAQTSSPGLISVWLAVTGALLLATARRDGSREIGIGHALAIGVAQGLAVLPGLSRSGATIATALLLGVRRDEAARFSIAVSIPAIAGAIALEAPELRHAEIRFLPAALGVLAAAIAGAAALGAIFAIVRRGRTWAFAIYLFPLAAVVWTLAA